MGIEEEIAARKLIREAAGQNVDDLEKEELIEQLHAKMLEAAANQRVRGGGRISRPDRQVEGREGRLRTAAWEEEAEEKQFLIISPPRGDEKSAFRVCYNGNLERTLVARGGPPVSEEFLLECRVDQPAVLAGQGSDVYVMATINPNPARLGSLHEVGPAQSLPAHIIVLVDVSGSMHEIIRDDPHARIIGYDVAEGQQVAVVQTTVPSRLAVAQGVVRRLIDRMTPADRLTLVAFDHQAYPLLAGASAADKLPMYRAAASLGETGGGGTSMGRGMQAVLKSLAGKQDEATRRLVLLTDGKDQEPDLALEQAHAVGTQNHIPIHAFGTGECRADFLKQVAQASGAFDYIFREEEAEQCFDRVFRSQQNILATKVMLSLWLSPEIFVQELYRTRPEILYVGVMKPDANNVLTVPIEHMERGKEYQFLFQCKLPAQGAGRLSAGACDLDL